MLLVIDCLAVKEWTQQHRSFFFNVRFARFNICTTNWFFLSCRDDNYMLCIYICSSFGNHTNINETVNDSRSRTAKIMDIARLMGGRDDCVCVVNHRRTSCAHIPQETNLIKPDDNLILSNTDVLSY